MEILPPGLALGLSSTQGILDTRDSQGVAEQICNALDYNKIKKQDEADSAARTTSMSIPPATKKYRPPGYLVGAGGLAALILAALLVFRSSADVPSPESAAGPASQASPNASSVTALPTTGKFALEKTAFAPAEPIYVDLPRFPKETEERMLKQGAMVGVARADAEQGQYLSHEFIASPERRIKLRAPLEAGDYEVRWYDNGSVLTQASLLGAVRFAVQGNSINAFAFKVEKTAYAPGEPIVVDVSSVPKRLIDDGALVGVFRKNAAPDEFVAYQPIRARDERIGFDAPANPGEYEIRGHINNFLLDEPTLVARTPFAVLAPPARESKP
jgi:hypothetical protein